MKKKIMILTGVALLVAALLFMIDFDAISLVGEGEEMENSYSFDEAADDTSDDTRWYIAFPCFIVGTALLGISMFIKDNHRKH